MTSPEPVLLPLWHLAHAADWEAAQASGRYGISTRGRTLAQEGFIHCAYPHQLAAVAGAFYADDPEPLVVLEIDRDVLARHGVIVRVEEVPAVGDGFPQRFPHIFGPIFTDAVLSVRPAAFDGDGVFGLGTALSADEYDSLIETSEILRDAEAMDDIREADAAVARCDVYSLEDVKAGMRNSGCPYR